MQTALPSARAALQRGRERRLANRPRRCGRRCVGLSFEWMSLTSDTGAARAAAPGMTGRPAARRERRAEKVTSCRHGRAPTSGSAHDCSRNRDAPRRRRQSTSAHDAQLRAPARTGGARRRRLRRAVPWRARGAPTVHDFSAASTARRRVKCTGGRASAMTSSIEAPASIAMRALCSCVELAQRGRQDRAGRGAGDPGLGELRLDLGHASGKRGVDDRVERERGGVGDHRKHVVDADASSRPCAYSASLRISLKRGAAIAAEQRHERRARIRRNRQRRRARISSSTRRASSARSSA